MNDNPQIRIYVNKIENRITSKIKAGYKLEGSQEFRRHLKEKIMKKAWNLINKYLKKHIYLQKKDRKLLMIKG